MKVAGPLIIVAHQTTVAQLISPVSKKQETLPETVEEKNSSDWLTGRKCTSLS